MNLKRPVLRYHGSKWRLAPWIVRHMPPHRVYVEPYGGGAGVLLLKQRSYAEVYNDLDGEIVNLFRVLRDHGPDLARQIEWTPFSRAEYRLSFAASDDPIEQARRTLVRSHMGFGSNALNRNVGSGWRSSATRSGTTPAHDWATLPPNILAAASRMRGVFIEHADALAIIRQHDAPHTLIYCDPPYVHSTRTVPRRRGRHGYTYEMSDDDHREMAAVLRSVKGLVMLSGYHSPLYDELFGDWYRIETAARGDGACERLEVLWFNRRAEPAGLFNGMEGE